MQLYILFLTVLLTSFLATLSWSYYARKRRWFDLPSHRSSHVTPTPTSGGIGFVVTFTSFSLILFWWRILSFNELLIFSAPLLLAATGFIDDLKSLSIRKRLLAQFAACGLVVFTFQGAPEILIVEGLQIDGLVARILILFGLLWLVNLYNFMDGIDGLAVAEAIFFAIAIALLTLLEGHTKLSIMTLGLAISLCGFLYFNLPPAAIFMGDVGSNYLGLVLGVSGVLGILSGTVNVWTILVLLGAFIVDATTTLITRMRAGHVWYHGHNLHAYQCAARRLRSHGKVVTIVCGINIIWLLPLAWMTIRYREAGLLLTVLAWTPLALLSSYCRKNWQNRGKNR